MQAGMSPTQIGSGANYGGSIPMPTTQSETGNTFHLGKSPVMWGIGFFVLGMLMLMYIHYK
jgi:hypothetical protein